MSERDLAILKCSIGLLLMENVYSNAKPHPADFGTWEIMFICRERPRA